MLVLTFYHRSTSIVFAQYKLYGKKFILNNKVTIEAADNQQLLCTEFNLQHKPVKQVVINDGIENKQFNYSKILASELFTNMKPDLIVHKISIGSVEFDSICRLNQINIEKLHKFNHLAPQLQPKELELAKYTEIVFNNAKHYACFNNSFHHTINKPYNLIFANLEKQSNLEFYGTSGLIFSSIVGKIPDLTEKKISKGKWVILYLEDNHTNLCAVKNGRSVYCSNSEIWHELADHTHGEPIDTQLLTMIAENNSQPLDVILQTTAKYNLASIVGNDSLNKEQEQYFTRQVSGAICRLGALLNGLDGIIFTGKITQNSPTLRQEICDNLAWIGVNISNKANTENQTKLSKKNSRIQVFSLSSEPETAMLQHLLERI